MQAATIAVVHDVPPAAVLWPLLLTAGVYLLLRYLIRGARGHEVSAAASRHAFCIGVLGWLGSSLLPAANAGILPVPETASRPVEILPALAWPVLGCLAVHILGQLSYPRARTVEAQAGAVRPIRTFLPRRLAWTVAAVFLFSAAQIVRTSTLSGFAAHPYGSRPDGSGGHATFGGEGRIPGVELAAYLGGALLVLAVGTLLVLALTARRPPMAGLGSKADGLLRTITANRLLRTVATVAAGLAAIAGNHAARPDPGTGPANWFNPAGVLNLAVLLVMLLWAPPRLPGPSPARGNGAAGAQPVTKLLVSIGAVMGLAAFLPVPAAIFVPGALTGHPALFVAGSAVSVLAVVSLGEVVVHRNYGTAGGPRRWPRQTVSPAMAYTFVIAAAILVAAICVVAWRQAGLQVGPSWMMAAWTSAATALFSCVPLVLAGTRNSVSGPAQGLDAALRAITVHRVVRTLATFLVAQAGVLLMSEGPKLHRASPPGQEPWDFAWQAAPAVGVLLATAAVVIAVIPVAGVRSSGDAPVPPANNPQPVDLTGEHPNAL